MGVSLTFERYQKKDLSSNNWEDVDLPIDYIYLGKNRDLRKFIQECPSVVIREDESVSGYEVAILAKDLRDCFDICELTHTLYVFGCFMNNYIIKNDDECHIRLIFSWSF